MTYDRKLLYTLTLNYFNGASALNDKNLLTAHKIAELVTQSGGRVFYVGGYVRDSVMKRVSKDIDIEVHGLELSELVKILEALGQVQTMGASFEILNLKHYQLDISLPEDVNGGTYKAALRRDFTINALMQDVMTGEILDYFGGLADIRNKVIRAVSQKTFELDPLRVFRAARFASVLNFRLDDGTIKLASRVKVDSLPCERVMNELSLSLLKSNEPAKFFDVLNNSTQSGYWFGEVKNVPDLTKILNPASSVKDSAREKLYFMMSALCYELDEDSCEKFLTRLTVEARLIKYVLNMKKLLPELIIAQSEESYMKIFDEAVCAKDLLLLANLIDDSNSQERENYLELYTSRMSEPYLTGHDLISAGFEQGVRLGQALKYAHELRLRGFTKEQQLELTLALRL